MDRNDLHQITTCVRITFVFVNTCTPQKWSLWGHEINNTIKSIVWWITSTLKAMLLIQRFEYIDWIAAWSLDKFNHQYDVHQIVHLHKYACWRTWNTYIRSCVCCVVAFVVMFRYLFCPFFHKCRSLIIF